MTDPLALPAASRAELARWVLRRRARFRVTGPSMEPTLRHGDVVFLDLGAEPELGDIVVAFHPRRSELKIVKRLVGGSAVDGWLLGSDNSTDSDAQDSRTFGAVAATAIVGPVTSVLR